MPHEIVIDEYVEATCTADGKTEGKHCKNCTYVETKQETIKALGHNFEFETNKCSLCDEKEYLEVKTRDDWNKNIGEKEYVVWLNYMGYESSTHYYSSIPSTVEYIKFIGSHTEEYDVYLIFESREKNLTLDFINVNFTSYGNNAITCESAVDININFYGEKCSFIPQKAKNGVRGGITNDPGYGETGYSGIYAPHAKVNILCATKSLAIYGGEGGNGGDGGLLGASDVDGKPGATGGTGIVGGEINVKFAEGYSKQNMDVKGGKGGKGGKYNGYSLWASDAKDGEEGKATSTTIVYI